MIPLNSLTKSSNDNEIILSWLSDKPSKLTQKQYQVNIRQFINYVGCTLADVKYEDVQGYVRMLEMKGYKASTVRTKLTSVKSLFSFSYKLGYLRANIGSLIRYKANDSKLNDKLINHEDIKLMCQNTYYLRDKLIIKTLYSLGLRVSECINIKWTDFYLDDSFINLTVTGKGDKPRTLLVSNSLYSELLKLKEDSIDYVFHAYSRNTPLTRQSVNIFLTKLEKKLGLEANITPHKFRHSHATTSIKNGCDLSLLQQSLGHSSIRTTERYLNYRKNEGSTQFIDI
jgi:integrase/recombinase XerD